MFCLVRVLNLTPEIKFTTDIYFRSLGQSGTFIPAKIIGYGDRNDLSKRGSTDQPQ